MISLFKSPCQDPGGFDVLIRLDSPLPVISHTRSDRVVKRFRRISKASAFRADEDAV